MPNNKYYGATMTQANVGTYYPNNADFDGFVFQQMIIDGNNANDRYNLIAYATFKANPPVPVALTATNGFLNSKQTVQFANMKLGIAGLKTLYPTGVNADITITPMAYYQNTGYIVYQATTPGKIHPMVNSYNLNPSPPA